MKDKLKIGITCYPTIGGSGVVATELGILLAERGHEVHFITHSIPFRLGKFDRHIYYHEVEVSDYHVFQYPPYDLSLANKIAQVAKMQKLDVLHVHYAFPHAVSALLAKQMVGPHLKVVTTLHGTDITILGQDESLSDLIRLAINDSDAVTAVSLDLIKETKRTLAIQKEIDLVYNFVDKRVYYPKKVESLRNEFALPDEKLFIHISNFRPVKRVSDVLEVFAKVNKEIPSKLIFIGEGPDLSKINCRARELGLEDRIHFCGKQDDVTEVLSISDLMLLTSEKESFGLVALEAMACGVPTVGSEAGGIPEVISHGENGFLAPVGDIEAMARYAIRLLKDEKLYQQFSNEGIKRSQTKFCNNKISKQYEAIYRRVLGCKESKSLESNVCMG